MKLVDAEAVKASLGRWADKWVHPEVAHSLDAAIDALPAWKPDYKSAAIYLHNSLRTFADALIEPWAEGSALTARIYHWHTDDSDWTPLCGAPLLSNGIAYVHSGVTCRKCRASLTAPEAAGDCERTNVSVNGHGASYWYDMHIVERGRAERAEANLAAIHRRADALLMDKRHLEAKLAAVRALPRMDGCVEDVDLDRALATGEDV